MATKLSSNVADLSNEQRSVLESLIGQPLRDDQVLFWVVASRGQEPTPANKAQAREGLQELFAKIDRHAADQGTNSSEFDAAVDEAVQQIRSQAAE